MISRRVSGREATRRKARWLSCRIEAVGEGPQGRQEANARIAAERAAYAP